MFFVFFHPWYLVFAFWAICAYPSFFTKVQSDFDDLSSQEDKVVWEGFSGFQIPVNAGHLERKRQLWHIAWTRHPDRAEALV